MLIDTHAHLFWDSYQDDFDAVIDRSIEAGVTTIINVGVDIETCKKSINLNSDKLSFFSSIGIHPHEAKKYFSNPDVSIRNDIEQLGIVYQESVSLPTRTKIVAIGECGLDYFFDGNPGLTPIDLSPDQTKMLQKKLFQSQIELSKKLDLPLLIHCRDAWTDIFEDLSGTKGLFHTFSGSLKDAKRALDLGYYLSFSGVITYPKNEALRQIVKNTPLDKILTETDCPFLPPQSKRGQRNEPANVKEIVQLIAELKTLSYQDCSNQIFENAKKLFTIA